MKLAMYPVFLTLVTIFLSSPSQGQSYPQAFTAEAFEDAIRNEDKVVFYFVSSRMPLSRLGAVSILEASERLGYKVQYVNDAYGPLEMDGEIPLPATPSWFTVEGGVPLHFPSMLVYEKGKKCGPAIPGNKSTARYLEILEGLGTSCAAYRGTEEKSLDFTRPQEVRIVENTVVNKTLGYYFKPIDQDWITTYRYDDDSKLKVFLFNRKTLVEFRVPGQADGFASPDGKIFTSLTPRSPDKMISFFSMEKIFQNPETAHALAPDFVDRTFQDQYQSIGLLGVQDSVRKYRVLQAFNSKPKIRDYEWEERGNAFMALGSATPLCPDLKIAVPMLSKDGLMAAGISENDGKTKVIFLGSSGTECQLVADLGIRTSKVGFSHDGKLISFTINGNSSAFVYNLEKKAMVEIFTKIPRESIVFPEFLPNGNVILMSVGDGVSRILELEVTF